jgi:hypothetical protein
MDKSELSFKFSIPITLDDVNGYKKAISSYMSLLHTYEIAIKKRDQDFNNQLRASIEQNVIIRAEQDNVAVQTETKVEQIKKIRKPRVVKPVGDEIFFL